LFFVVITVARQFVISLLGLCCLDFPSLRAVAPRVLKEKKRNLAVRTSGKTIRAKAVTVAIKILFTVSP